MKYNKIIIAITGASGSIYAKQLINKLQLQENAPDIALIFSDNGKKVWDYELNNEKIDNKKIPIFSSNNFFAPPASGSSNYDAMIIIPCSMGTMGRIANGTSDNLIIRAADVMLKEKRKLIIVPRESPYNLIHIRNMETLLLAGAEILPASPSFYSKPQTLEELVNTIIERILSSLNYNNGNYKWGEKNHSITIE